MREGAVKQSAQVEACTDLLYSKITAKYVTGGSVLLDTIHVNPRETEKVVTQCVSVCLA